MPSHVTIRPAAVDDAQALADAWIAFGRYYADLDPAHFRVPDQDGITEWVRGEIARERDPDFLWLVAERDGRFLGYVQAVITRPAEDADRQLVVDVGESVLHVNAVLVLEGERRRGVGTALMTAAEDWGRAGGATRSYLNTYATSPSSMPFYAERMRYLAKMTGFWKPL
jgi:GNAT superfamily N-acetyltransferase